MKHPKRLKTGIFAGIFLLVAVSIFGQEAEQKEHASPARLFSRGNDYYEKGEFDNAINEYEKIIAEGYESGPLYYNIANAYFKTGNLGKAVLNYKRAKLIMPRDADLDANYRFARAMIKGKIIHMKGVWAWRPLRIYYRSFTVNGFTLLSSAMYLLILLLLVVVVVRPHLMRYSITGSILLLVFILFNFAVIGHETRVVNKGAVTVVPDADALYGPFDSATKFFTLHEGMYVMVLKTKDDWCKVKRIDGKVGWIKKKDIERIK